MIASGILFAAFSVFGKPIASQFGSLTLNSFAYVSGAVLLLPFALLGLSHYDVSRVSAGAWTGILYMAIFPSIAGYLIYSYALRYLPASRVSSVGYLQPVTATLLAVIFLHENPGAPFVLGAALVLAGVFFTENRATARPPTRRISP
jgi:drug/metabolite transporter (DMT)-like permease